LGHHEHIRRFTSGNTFARNTVVSFGRLSFCNFSFNVDAYVKWYQFFVWTSAFNKSPSGSKEAKSTASSKFVFLSPASSHGVAFRISSRVCLALD
jgi:hypothetical protein